MNLSPYLPPKHFEKDNAGDHHHHREFALAQRFLDAGVFLHPNEEHGKESGWFRLVYSHDEDTLQEGLKR